MRMLDWVPSARAVPQPLAGMTNEYFERLLPNATYLGSDLSRNKHGDIAISISKNLTHNFLECEAVQEKNKQNIASFYWI